jgi:hypothetical protein
LYKTIEPLVSVIEEIKPPSGTQMKIPWFIVEPVKPNVVIKEAPALSKQAETMAFEFTTKPRYFPVVALVPVTKRLPVYPAENDVDEMLIYLYNEFLRLCCGYRADALRPQSSIAAFNRIF